MSGLNVMEDYNIRKRKRFELLSRREWEFLRDPKGFREKYGDNYVRQMRYRIRRKIEAAVEVIEYIYNRIYDKKDEEFEREIMIGRKPIYDSYSWFLTDFYWNSQSGKWKM